MSRSSQQNLHVELENLDLLQKYWSKFEILNRVTVGNQCLTQSQGQQARIAQGICKLRTVHSPNHFSKLAICPLVLCKNRVSLRCKSNSLGFHFLHLYQSDPMLS